MVQTAFHLALLTFTLALSTWLILLFTWLLIFPYLCIMFSKQEAQQLKKEFWTAFGKSFPRKWILYDTKIKDLSFKFYADNKKAEVSLDIEMKDEIFRNAYYEKIWSLEDILKDFIGDFHKDEYYTLENGKVMARIWVEKHQVSIFNKNTWQQIFEFFLEKMDGFERFYYEYEDFIKDV